MTLPSACARRWGIGAVAAVAVVAVATAFFVQDAIPAWVRWESQTVKTTLADGSGATVIVRDGVVSICGETGDTIAKTDAAWRVQQVAVSDIDGDGLQELILLSWRRGSYGSSRPFWVREDDRRWSQHVFVMRPTDAGLDPVWMSSDIGMEATSIEIASRSRIVIGCRSGDRSLWEWLGWGFTLIDDS